MKLNTKKKFIILSAIISLIFFEILSYTYFILNDVKNLNYYLERKIGLSGFKYYEKYEVVLPKPGTKKIIKKKEYRDEFIAKDVLGEGFGVWDEGVNANREIKIATLGDSFAVGVGSIDPINKNIFSLIEDKKNKYEITNLGGIGKGIHDQSYFFYKIENLVDYDIMIYNFFSGGDYIDNLNDFSSNLYVKKISQNLSDIKTQDLINKLNTTHGFKNHLEYLANNNIKLYSIYFLLKIYDLSIIKANKLLNINFQDLNKKIYAKYPKDLGRLKVVKNDIYQIYGMSKKKRERICEVKYCFEHEGVFEDSLIQKKVVDNSAYFINKFYNHINKKNKKFLLIVHPSARNLFSKKKTVIDYNELDNILIEKLDKNIKVIDLRKFLIDYENSNPSKRIFWKMDGHYTPFGYKISSDYVLRKMEKILNTN